MRFQRSSQHPRVPWTDTVIYEAHVRGMTVLNLDLPDGERGTYAGLAHPTVIEHLLSLGVTTLELMPVFAFATEPVVAARGLSNYWGYNTVDFFTPHAPYAAGNDAPGEFAAMVDRLHAAGLEVLLDVVYNHTVEGAFDASWYRPIDVTGCGNSLDTSRHDVQDLIIESLSFWAGDMGVDGFRFDLGSALARDTEHRPAPPGELLQRIADDRLLGTCKLIIEPWDAAPDGYALGQFGAPFTEWNDRFRDDVRDYWRGAAGAGALAMRLAGSSDHFDTPWRSVNFVTAHDGFTVRDVVSYNHKHNEANGEDGRDGQDDNHSDNCGVEGASADPVIVARRQQRAANLLATTLLARGVPMLRMGDEFGHSQGGNNNAYCQDNGISWMSWTAAPGWDLRQLIADVVAVRDRLLKADGLEFADFGWFGKDGLPLADSDWDDPAHTGLGMSIGEHALWFDSAADEIWLRLGDTGHDVRVAPLGLGT